MRRDDGKSFSDLLKCKVYLMYRTPSFYARYLMHHTKCVEVFAVSEWHDDVPKQQNL